MTPWGSSWPGFERKNRMEENGTSSHFGRVEEFELWINCHSDTRVLHSTLLVVEHWGLFKAARAKERGNPSNRERGRRGKRGFEVPRLLASLHSILLRKTKKLKLVGRENHCLSLSLCKSHLFALVFIDPALFQPVGRRTRFPYSLYFTLKTSSDLRERQTRSSLRTLLVGTSPIKCHKIPFRHSFGSAFIAIVCFNFHRRRQ